jgi:2,2-dialkylglycine decarboxylase (pyruvate)
LLLGMEFVPYAGHSAAAISQRVIELALEFGLSANITGAFTAGVMRFAPPLTSSDEEIDFGISVLDRAITQVVDSL